MEFGTPVPGQVYQERPGAYAVILNEQGEVAVIRTDRGHFLPGGGIDGNEEPAEALRRELLEETGYEVTDLLPLGRAIHYGHSPRAGYLKSTGSFFAARLGEKRAEPSEADHELIWVTPEQAAALLVLEHQAWAVGQAMG